MYLLIRGTAIIPLDKIEVILVVLSFTAIQILSKQKKGLCRNSVDDLVTIGLYTEQYKHFRLQHTKSGE